MSDQDQGTVERPVYRAQKQDGTQNFWFITVDEGWRSSILCTDMYPWSAEWLVKQLQGKPYAPGNPS